MPPRLHAVPLRAATGARVRCPLQALRCSQPTLPEPPPHAAAAALSGAAATLPLPGSEVLLLPGFIVTGGAAAVLPLP